MDTIILTEKEYFEKKAEVFISSIIQGMLDSEILEVDISEIVFNSWHQFCLTLSVQYSSDRIKKSQQLYLNIFTKLINEVKTELNQVDEEKAFIELKGFSNNLQALMDYLFCRRKGCNVTEALGIVKRVNLI